MGGHPCGEAPARLSVLYSIWKSCATQQKMSSVAYQYISLFVICFTVSHSHIDIKSPQVGQCITTDTFLSGALRI
jgi:hypothetical protein